MILAVRRRRYCRACGSVQVGDPDDRCLECGAFALTQNGEPWRRVRVRKDGEEGER